MADEVVKDTIDTTLDKTLETKTEKTSLKDVIKAATNESKDILKEETPKEEVKAEAKEEPKKEETLTKEEIKLTDEQRKFADNLYLALNNPDPKIQLQTLKLLATAAGQDLKEVETVKEVKATVKDIKTLLKEGLGEFDFLADKLGPVLETVLKDLVEKQTKDIREDVKADKEAKQKDIVVKAVDDAFGEFTNSIEVKDEVMKLMDQFIPSAKMSHKEYFRSLIVLAASNKGINLKSVNASKDNEKVTRNRNDAASRLASERGAEVKDVVRTTQFKNVKDAVRDAAERAAELMGAKNK